MRKHTRNALFKRLLVIGSAALALLPANVAWAATRLPVLSSDVDVPDAVPIVVTVELDSQDTMEKAMEAIRGYRQEAIDEGIVSQAELDAAGISEYDYLYGFTWSPEIERIAIQRSVENEFHYDHHRPDGRYFYSVENGEYVTATEVIASPTGDVLYGLELFASEKEDYVGKTGAETGHYTYIIDPAFDHYGMAAAIPGLVVGECGFTGSSLDYGTDCLGYEGTYEVVVNVRDDDYDDLFEGWRHYSLDLSASLPRTRMGEGATQQLEVTADFGPSGAVETYPVATELIEYSSSDPEVAEVNDEGIVKAMGEGKATITAYAGDHTASVDVTVSGTCQVSRIHGYSALQTMQAIVGYDKYRSDAFGNVFKAGRGGTVVVTTLGGYWDALTAAGLAGVKDACILMTDTDELSEETKTELSRLEPKTIIICGGPLSVSEDVEEELGSYATKVERIEGDDAAVTAVEIFEGAKGWSDTAIVATSNGYWDALAIAPYSYAFQAPIFLTDADGTLSKTTLNAIKGGKFDEVIIVGGRQSVSREVEDQLGSLFSERLGGKDAIETSSLIAEYELDQGMGTDMLGVASGSGYWDALAAAPLCGQRNSVLVLALPDRHEAIDDILDSRKKKVGHVFVFGGPLSVSEETFDYLEEAME